MHAMIEPPPSKQTSLKVRIRLWVIAPIVVVLIAYLWFISAGMWFPWPKTSIYDYYSGLALAFQHGHLYLDEEPRPELLALPDPYRIGARKGIPHIWDASLYQGHYYLYWGPAPALVLLPIQSILGIQPISDLYLVLGFVYLLYLIICALMVRTWRRYFSDLPPWTLALGLLLGGLAPPLTWMLNRPEVYEAAIAAGQFFLLTGVYLFYAAIGSGKPSAAKLALTSGCWGLAIASRTSHALPVAFLLIAAGSMLAASIRQSGVTPAFSRAAVALVVPLLISVLALLWYNWARFGSALEFGYRYQLTLLHLPKHYGEIMSPAYVLPNLSNYFLNPFTTNAIFPFIRPQYGAEFSSNPSVPAIYFSEAVTGLLYTFPFILIGLHGSLVRKHQEPAARDVDKSPIPDRSLRWFLLSLAGVLVLEFCTLLFFFFATERYLADGVPVLTLLCVIGFWRAHKLFSDRPKTRALLSIAAIALALISIVSTSLLAISSSQDRFLRTNPELMQRISQFFGL